MPALSGGNVRIGGKGHGGGGEKRSRSRGALDDGKRSSAGSRASLDPSALKPPLNPALHAPAAALDSVRVPIQLTLHRPLRLYNHS